MRILRIPCLLAIVALQLGAQPEGWTQPFPGHRVIGNLYAVGTHDLGVFLITSDEGHILINTALSESTPLIRRNIESLGFRMDDIRILLSMQAHWDAHGGTAEIKRTTGARMWATAGDAPVLEDGGFSDPHFGGRVSFEPVEVDRTLADGEVIELGDTRLTVIESPGHTAGSSSYAMTVREGGREYPRRHRKHGDDHRGKRLIGDPTYPGVAEDFAKTFRRQRAMEIDVWVAAHGSQLRPARKVQAGPGLQPGHLCGSGWIPCRRRTARRVVPQTDRERGSGSPCWEPEVAGPFTCGSVETALRSPGAGPYNAGSAGCDVTLGASRSQHERRSEQPGRLEPVQPGTVACAIPDCGHRLAGLRAGSVQPGKGAGAVANRERTPDPVRLSRGRGRTDPEPARARRFSGSQRRRPGSDPAGRRIPDALPSRRGCVPGTARSASRTWCRIAGELSVEAWIQALAGSWIRFLRDRRHVERSDQRNFELGRLAAGIGPCSARVERAREGAPQVGTPGRERRGMRSLTWCSPGIGPGARACS